MQTKKSAMAVAVMSLGVFRLQEGWANKNFSKLRHTVNPINGAPVCLLVASANPAQLIIIGLP